jgi:ADP-heptose:LPS heptosyltransferase
MAHDETVRSVLVYVGGEIMGDGLNKLPFLRALRRAYPKARVTWFAGSGPTVYTGKLAPAVECLIDEVIDRRDTPESWANALRPRLSDRHFDVIIDTKRKLRATVELKRIPHEVLVSGTANGLLSERRAPGQPFRAAKPEHFQDQLLQLLSLARYGRVDGPVDPSGSVEVPTACHTAAARLLPQDAGVLLAPGAGGADKRWPLENFLEIGRRLAAAGWVPVFALGPGEEHLHAQIARAVPEARLPLQDAGAGELKHEPFLTMALAKRCRGALANDSGNAHIVAAAGTALLVLFGRTSAAKFAPRGAQVRFLQAADFGGGSIDALPLEAVYRELTALLARSAAQASQADAGTAAEP